MAKHRHGFIDKRALGDRQRKYDDGVKYLQRRWDDPQAYSAAERRELEAKLQRWVRTHEAQAHEDISAEVD